MTEIKRVTHPRLDGTYVEFHGMSVRQLDILAEYEKLIKKYEHNKQNKINIKSKT